MAKDAKKQQVSMYLPPELAAWVDQSRGTFTRSAYMVATLSMVMKRAKATTSSKKVSAFTPDIDGLDVKKALKEMAGDPPPEKP